MTSRPAPKSEGSASGFAGVGIKIGLLVSDEVLTETRSGKHHMATTWSLASRHRAPWKWVTPPGLVGERGTAVRIKLASALSPLLDTGFVETALRHHFQPLFDPALAGMLGTRYPRGVRVVLNGQPLAHRGWEAPAVAPVAVRLARKRKPAVAGYMISNRLGLPEDRRGIAISTYGKIIKRGWDWLGVTPAAPEHVDGLVEAPGLADCLTLNKADFIRAGGRGATYLAYRKAIQEAVSQQLATWGDARGEGEYARRRAARPVERDLEAVLADLADHFPLLAALVERRAGGQRRLPIGRTAPGDGAGAQFAPAESAQVGRVESPPPGDQVPEEPTPPTVREGPVPIVAPPPAGPRRPARYGLSIQFEQRADDPELGRLVESTVWINEAHPAYRRAVVSRSEGYHLALATAMALASLAVEPAKEHVFVTEFLVSWGRAIDRRKTGRRAG